MAITKPQLDQAAVTMPQLLAVANKLQFLIGKTQDLMTSSWVITSTLGDIQVLTTISSADQTNILNQYQTLKANLASLYQQLP